MMASTRPEVVLIKIPRYALSGNEFMTDANSLEMVKRVRGRRSGFAPVELADKDTANPLGGNYYPITSSIAIADNATRQQLVLITERGQGDVK